MEWLTGEMWVILAVIAVGVGITKTAVPGLGTLLAAILATIMPARASTGLLLLVLLVGDVLAVALYRRSADRKVLFALFLPMAVGLVLGAGFLQVADDAGVRVTIGAIILVMVAMEVFRRLRARRRDLAAAGAAPEDVAPVEDVPPAEDAAPAEDVPPADDAAPAAEVPAPSDGSRNPARRLASWLYGALAGFTTMVANSGGPVVSVYFLSMRYTKLQFMGTSAWLFFTVNAAKVPLSVGVGVITWDTVRVAALLVPAVLVGGAIGRMLFKHIDQRLFDRLVLVLSALAAVNLLR